MARSANASRQAGYTTASDRRHRHDHRIVADFREESIYGMLASCPSHEFVWRVQDGISIDEISLPELLERRRDNRVVTTA
jgi:hypothetical protein